MRARLGLAGMRARLANVVACLVGVHPLTVDWKSGEWVCVVPWCRYSEAMFREGE